mmetsp:Transcript_50490/g.130062  ORF Transcript_50490/g.130062 Transcript_50490/m.130062 type:complete len:220 (-) Transcript_50490:511-1170(-)
MWPRPPDKAHERLKKGGRRGGVKNTGRPLDPAALCDARISGLVSARDHPACPRMERGPRGLAGQGPGDWRPVARGEAERGLRPAGHDRMEGAGQDPSWDRCPQQELPGCVREKPAASRARGRGARASQGGAYSQSQRRAGPRSKAARPTPPLGSQRTSMMAFAVPPSVSVLSRPYCSTFCCLPWIGAATTSTAFSRRRYRWKAERKREAVTASVKLTKA